MKMLLIARPVVALGVLAIVVTGCPSADPPASRARQHAPAPESSTSPLMSTASVSSEVVLRVDGLTCEGCAWQIRDTLDKVDGVAEVRTTVADKRVVVTYDGDRINAEAVRQALKEVGYESVEISR